MKILIAIGGNALLQKGQPLEPDIQVKNINNAAKIIKKISQQHQIVLCHGNGPQVGLLSLLSNAYRDISPFSLDVLVAETQGMIGYLLQKSLYNEGIKNIVTLITQTRISINDSAFKTPTKPIGAVYNYETATQLVQEKEWEMASEGNYYRRVVASPAPQSVIELKAAKILIKKGYFVIFCGGGGIPVIENEKTGFLLGKEAVIDKDLTSALVAIELNMDMLLILTDIDAIYADWGSKTQKAIKLISPNELKKMEFAKGSMGPKVEAACNFVLKTNKTAIIGNLSQGETLLNGNSGTLIDKNAEQTIYY